MLCEVEICCQRLKRTASKASVTKEKEKKKYYFDLEIKMKFLAMEGARLQNSYPGGAPIKPV